MKIEIRSASEAVIEGYVNAVERDSRLLPRSMCPGAKGSFYEQVRAGTFQRALEKGKAVELRFNHSRNIGSSDSNLELREDNIGLHAKAVITDPNVVAKAKAGVFSLISESLINNSRFDVVSVVIERMANSISRWLEKELLFGTIRRGRFAGPLLCFLRVFFIRNGGDAAYKAV